MKGNESIQTGRGAVLLRELKDLVDSFPEHRRKLVIEIIGTVLTRMGADFTKPAFSRPRPQTESHESSTSRETTGKTDLNK